MRNILLLVWLVLAGAPLIAGEASWSWQEPHATVDGKGDLTWKPAPFVFQAGAQVRCIDFAQGRDDQPGTREQPWQHHPWDPAATGLAKADAGTGTYLFKRGVVYRGRLVVRGLGTPAEPIRLTSDPAWGEGEAVICGSEPVGGWSKGADRKDIPEPERVWWVDLAFAPRCVWLVGADGAITRIPLARTPNWRVSDPDDVKSAWWQWDCKDGKTSDNHVKLGNNRLNLGIDAEHLTRPAAYYQDALVWTEHAWVSGAPFPARVEVVDPKRKGLGFGGRFGGVGSYTIAKFCRYFLEDKASYLDDPTGEFWFAKRGDGGRLYLRLPQDADPNASRIEVARHPTLIDSTGMAHVAITGLTFRFTNVHWKLDGFPYVDGEDLEPACIRLLGPGRDIRVANCRFEHVNCAVRMKAVGQGSAIDGVVITDNTVRSTDRGAFFLAEGSAWGEVFPEQGFLHDVKVLRNKLESIGLRPSRFNLGFAIHVFYAQTAEVAGNIVERCYSGGINVLGGKASASARDIPLSRLLIHHNKVTDSLLSNDDYGGIETWQGGPAYVYDNISGNPGGYRNHGQLKADKPGWARFGFAFYLDGAFKNYHFNNIAWGKSKDPASRLGNSAAFQEIISYQNTFFNNTVYNFVKGTRRQAPQAGRDKFLGNVWQGIGEWLFWHAPPANSPEEGNAADAGPQKTRYALETDVYARNVFHDLAPGRFGVLEPSGQWLGDLAAFRQVLAKGQAMAAGVGELSPAPPLRDPARSDFRLAPGSAAVDQGVRVFVPWPLYATVAEWNFYHAGDDPAAIIDEHWYLTPYHLQRDDYHLRPMYPLTLRNPTADSYVAGMLEDWTAGALALNGSDQYAVLANARLTEPFAYELGYKKGGKMVTEGRTAAGEDLKSPQVHRSSFVIEVYAKVQAGSAGGVLIEKMAATGYGLVVDAAGRAVFTVRGGEGSGSIVSATRLADGQWHHLLAECDRTARRLVLYVDGRQDAVGAGIGPETSLANAADLYVGGTPQGRCLAGTLDFMRLALGTLAEAKTTIAELYAWEFDGPFLRDFAGRAAKGARRDAGAIELTE